MTLTKATYSMIDGAPVNVLDFGATGDGVTNDAVAIQAAIDFAAANNTSLYFPEGVYAHTSTLVWKNGVRYFGPNVNVSNTKGAVLTYTGTNDANQINNPINASTFASIRIEGLTFVCSALAAGKALFYDTGSTYLYIEHCKFNFAGAGSFGLVFHQTEVSTISECIFEAIGNIGLGALIRLADGPVLKHPSAIVGYTNRITITNNQINPALGGSQAIGIWDDGGLVHSIKDNNLNGGSIGIYLLRPYPVEVANNEIEGYTTAGLSCGLTGAGITGLRIVNNYFLALPPALAFANNSIAEMTYTDNIISVLTPGNPCETNLSGNPDAKIFATNNREVSVGNVPFNNYLQQNTETVGNVLLAGSTTAGTQTYANNTIAWRLIGDVCYFDAYVVLAAKDPATAGEIRITGLPYTHRTTSATTTSLSVSLVSRISNSVGYTQTTACINPGENFIRLAESGSGVAASFLTAGTIVNTTAIAVSGMYPI